MTNRWTARAREARARLTGRRTPLTDDLWLGSPPEAPPVSITPVDDTTWLLQRDGGEGGERAREVVPIGDPDLRTDLLTAGRRVRGLKQSHHYEQQLLEHVSRGHLLWLLRRLAIDVVLDVGANRGQFARRLRETGYTGHIVSFEPVAASVEVLRRHSADDARWHVVPCALGRADGEAEIHVNDTLSSLLDASEFGVGWKESMAQPPTETIRVRRLDDVLDEVLPGVLGGAAGADGRARLFLKLDTQGFDLEAFAGLGGRADDVLGMQSEVSCLPIYEGMPSMTEQIETYTAAGFAITGMYPVSRHIRTMRVIEFDLFLVRNPSPDRPDRHP